MQSVQITTNTSSNPTHCEVYLIQCYVITFSVTCGRSVVFSRYCFPPPVKVTLNNITYAPSYIIGVSFISGWNCSTHWKPHSSPKSANFITVSSTPCHDHQILILNSDICSIKTVKPAHAFTFIKQSPVLKKKVKLFFSCHRKFPMNWTSFMWSPVLKFAKINFSNQYHMKGESSDVRCNEQSIHIK